MREKLGFDESQVMTTVQSRFGREPWLQPDTDKTLEQLPENGVKHVAVICPGFSSDCLETIEEINIEARESFIESGGEQFHYMPCLNDEPAHIDALVSILEKRLALSH